MTGAELPPPIPRQLPHPEFDPSGEFQDLPAPLGESLAPLVLWPAITEPAYHLVARRFGAGRQAEWTFFASLLVSSGIATPGPEPDSYTYPERWRLVLEHRLDAIGGAEAVRGRLLDAWLEQPEASLLSDMAAWARHLLRWDVMEQVWLLLGEHTADVPVEILEVLRDLPAEARKARPILTWASGAAAALLADNPRLEAEAVLQRILLDSALLHADWSVREDTDEAVSAGTFRMIGERRLPATRTGQSIDAAWRTKQEVDAFIDARSRAGKGPGRTPQAIFRVYSARLALFRNDPANAINEARWATILADWEPVAVLAAGVTALARTFSIEDGLPISDSPIPGVDDELGVRGMRGQGQVYLLLAEASAALRRLDRDEVERCLGLVSPAAAAVVGVWAVRAAVQGWWDGLWGDLNAGVETLSAAITRLSVLGREQDEPFGNALLTRTRVMLLTKAGALGMAAQSAEPMPEDLRLMSQALIHLWAGHYRQALLVADTAPYHPGLSSSGRSRLLVIRAAAALLDGSADEAIRREAVEVVRLLLRRQTFVHLAQLPKAARDAVLELCREELGTDPQFRLLEERLQDLNDAGRTSARPLRLTDREQVLLPLLATEASVPEIARELHVSVNTVRKQVVTLREKFEAESRSELVRKATAYGAI